MAKRYDAAIKSYEDINSEATKKEYGTGEDTFISVTIGMRGYFSRNAARRAAMTWRQAVAHYPKAIFYPNILGYDHDPREIWEFEDVCQYVKQWARFAGMHDPETVQRYCGDTPPGAIGFLAACGVFGDEMREEALTTSGMKPTPQQ